MKKAILLTLLVPTLLLGLNSSDRIIETLGELILKPANEVEVQGDILVKSENEVKFEDASGGEYVSLRANTTVPSNLELILPTADGSNTDILQTNGSGQLSFVSRPAEFTFTASNDNRIVRSDTVGTDEIQESGITIDDSDNVTGVTSLTIGGSLDASSILDTTSTTKGTRPAPSMTEAQRDAISSPATGLLIYNSDDDVYNYYDGTQWTEIGVGGAGGATEFSGLLQNAGFDVSMSASAVTVSLKQKDGSTDPSTGTAAVNFGFRNTSATSGGFEIVSVTSSLSVTGTSGATLGCVDGVLCRTYVYAINNAGSAELALSGKVFNDSELVTTTAMSAACDTPQQICSTTSRSNVPLLLLGYFESTQATAGSWVTNATLEHVGSEAVSDYIRAPKASQNVFICGFRIDSAANTVIERVPCNGGRCCTADDGTDGGTGVHTVNLHDGYFDGLGYTCSCNALGGLVYTTVGLGASDTVTVFHRLAAGGLTNEQSSCLCVGLSGN